MCASLALGSTARTPLAAWFHGAATLTAGTEPAERGDKVVGRTTRALRVLKLQQPPRVDRPHSEGVGRLLCCDGRVSGPALALVPIRAIGRHAAHHIRLLPPQRSVQDRVERRIGESKRGVLNDCSVHLDRADRLLSKRVAEAAHFGVSEAVLGERRHVRLASRIARACVNIRCLRATQVAHVDRTVRRAIRRVHQKLRMANGHILPARTTQVTEAHNAGEVLPKIEDLHTRRRHAGSPRRALVQVARGLEERRGQHGPVCNR